MPVRGVQAHDTGRQLDALLNGLGATHQVDPVELLGGGVIGEGGWNEHALREHPWPDVSYGFGQPSAAWVTLPEGLAPSADPRYRNADTPENRRRVREYFWDAERALAYVAPRYAALRRQWGEPLEAWCRWNKPNLAGASNPNRGHYAASLAAAEAYRVAAPPAEEEQPVAEQGPPQTVEERVAFLERENTTREQQQAFQTDALRFLASDLDEGQKRQELRRLVTALRGGQEPDWSAPDVPKA